uniref:Peptide chain release factor 1 n=1 Tax=Thermorudis peleae TaxID=1382356 RepID=A0A831TEU5_9BACT
MTRQAVERLASYHSPDWPIVSLYLRVDREHITDDHYSIRLKNLLKQVLDNPGIELSRAQLEAVEADLDRIRVFFRDHGDEFGQGVALFASSAANLWEVYEAPREVGNHVEVDFRPVIAPLVRVLELCEPFCVCLVSRDRARIFMGHMSEFGERAVRLDQEVPGQHEQGGWSQARYQRHIEEHVHQHFKRLAADLFALFEQEPFRFLVLGGPHEVVSDFLDYLHPYLRERYIGTFYVLMEASAKQVREEAAKIVREWLRQEKQRYLDLLRNEALSNDMGVTGLEKVVEALQMGNVLSLIVDDRLEAPGSSCLHCGAVQPPAAEQPDRCLYCGGPVRRHANIVPKVYANAYRQKANLVFLTERELQEQLAELGGIGAILRFRVTPAPGS